MCLLPHLIGKLHVLPIEDMAELFKDLYTAKHINEVTISLSQIDDTFNSKCFIEEVLKDNWDVLGFKQRIQKIAELLNKYLPQDFERASDVLLAYVERLESENKNQANLQYWFIPTYIEMYGFRYFETSMAAIERITRFVTCEFAVRPFYERYFDQMCKETILWTDHHDFRVRRLASEGCRTLLPWGKRVKELQENPQFIIGVLNKLKNDPHEWVRKSVANNMNDLSKHYPDLVINLMKEWYGQGKELDVLVKHGCRTLLKKGVPEVMRLFGYGTDGQIIVDEFSVISKDVEFGGGLEFEFKLRNKTSQKVLVRIEYTVYFKKANGSLTPKIFKISEIVMGPNEEVYRLKSHIIKKITTRKYYSGEHQIALVINGFEQRGVSFQLHME